MDPENDGTAVNYLGGTVENLESITSRSTQCYQDLEYECDADIKLADLDAWFDKDGKKVLFADSNIGEFFLDIRLSV